MGKERDYSFLVGNTYGRLTVLERSDPIVKPNGKKDKAYKCRCACGNIADIAAWRLASGDAKSCGCANNPNTIIGNRYGRLVVVRRAEDYVSKLGHHCIRYECVCDCGNTVIVHGSSIKGGTTTSCGCYQRDATIESHKKHGGTNERLYAVWINIKQRCLNKNNPSYKYYGARGVSICNDWLDYSNFRSWAYKNGYKDDANFGKCTIDRIDVNGDYSPENCRWITLQEQFLNRRSNVNIEINGESKSLTEWCSIYGVDSDYVRGRIRRGWNPLDALTTAKGCARNHKSGMVKRRVANE